MKKLIVPAVAFLILGGTINAQTHQKQPVKKATTTTAKTTAVTPASNTGSLTAKTVTPSKKTSTGPATTKTAKSPVVRKKHHKKPKKSMQKKN
jgi:hypothetical protein